MLIVKNVEVLNIPDDECVIMKYDGDSLLDGRFDQLLITQEAIRGRKFTIPVLDEHGFNSSKEVKKVIIGWSRDTEDAIGIPLACIESMSKLSLNHWKQYEALDRKHREFVDMADDRYNKVVRLSFFGRLKFLLFGFEYLP